MSLPAIYFAGLGMIAGCMLLPESLKGQLQ